MPGAGFEYTLHAVPSVHVANHPPEPSKNRSFAELSVWSTPNVTDVPASSTGVGLAADADVNDPVHPGSVTVTTAEVE